MVWYRMVCCVDTPKQKKGQKARWPSFCLIQSVCIMEYHVVRTSGVDVGGGDVANLLHMRMLYHQVAFED